MDPITLVSISHPRLENIKRLISQCHDYVDNIIIVTGQGNTAAAEYLNSIPKVRELFRPWDDSFAKQYQVYLDYLKSINYIGWVLICDDDELPSEALLKSLPQVIKESENGDKYSCVEFRCHPKDIEGGYEGQPSNYFRQIFFKFQPNMKYKVDLHQSLIGYKNHRMIKRDEVYYHIKSRKNELEGSCRNYFIGGIWPIGATQPSKDNTWNQLKALLNKHYPGTEYWRQLNDILVKGNIHLELKDWIIKYKDINGAPYGELRQFYPYYFDILHPEESPS